MAETADASMSAQDAVGVLVDLDGYEESLTARTAGITWMIWGTAVPGIFTTYGAATAWLETTSFAWILSFLWIPWIAGASLATNWLWKATAVTLDWDASSKQGWGYAAGFTLAFFVLAGAIWLTSQALGTTLGVNAWMLLAGGLLTVAIGFVYRRQRIPGPTEALVGGVVLAAAGLALAGATLEPRAFAGLLSAGLVGFVYYAMGIRLYRRG